MTSFEIEAVLNSQFVGRIGCCANGLPYVVPISYAYDGASVYCHSLDGQKLEMMRQNPKVCFQVDEFKDLANWKSVIAQGEFEELHHEEEIHRGVEVLLGRYLPIVSSQTMRLGRLWPFRPDNDSEIAGVFFRIKLGEKTGRYESANEAPALVG